jgi:hypothetical protein
MLCFLSCVADGGRGGPGLLRREEMLGAPIRASLGHRTSSEELSFRWAWFAWEWQPCSECGRMLCIVCFGAHRASSEELSFGCTRLFAVLLVRLMCCTW